MDGQNLVYSVPAVTEVETKLSTSNGTLRIAVMKKYVNITYPAIIALNVYPPMFVGSQILQQASLVLHRESTQLTKGYRHIGHTRNVRSRGDTGRLPRIRGGEYRNVLAMLAVHVIYTELLCNCTNTHAAVESLPIVWIKSPIPHMVHFKAEYHNRWHRSII